MTEQVATDETTNWCGTCTLCCKLLGVEELLPLKQAATWCPHCNIGNGCKIYEDRPVSCRTYVCVWRQFKEEGHDVPDELRPDRCRVIIDAAVDGSAHYIRCDPAMPEAWKKPLVQRFARMFAEHGRLALVIGDTRRWLKTL